MLKLKQTALLVALAGLALASASCRATDDPDDPDMTVAPDMPTTPIPEGFEPLITGEWTLGPNEEAYVCIYKRITEPTWVTGFHSLGPEGTHHSLLTLLPEVAVVDTTLRCSPTALGDQLIFGSGVGTETLEMPEGVAVRLEPGQQLLMNLHLFNVRSSELTGTSGVYARTAPESEIEFEAEVVLAGPSNFSVPPRAEDYLVEGSCTRPITQTAFAVMPHMHLFGTAFQLSVETEEGSTVLYDDVYDFDDQRYYDVPSIVLEPGDRIHAVCTYDNPNPSPVFFGESTLSEMCFGLTYLYPAAYDGRVFCSF